MNSLQNLCLDKIVSEFSRYYQTYCSTEDSSLKLKFEFLKKKFSFQIIQKLEEKYLKTEYLDFLINKYLKVLDTKWLKEWPWETVSQKLAEIGPNLEEITFCDRPWEKILCYLPNLKSVFMHHSSDEFLLHLSKCCDSIEILDISFSSRVSDSGLKNMCNFYVLPIKELFIAGTSIGDEGVAYVLKNMPSLQKVHYWRLSMVLYLIHKCDINALDKVKPYNLTHLDITTIMSFTIPDDMLKVCISVCPHLKSVFCPIFRKQHLYLYFQLQELEKLDLSCSKDLELNELLIRNGIKLTSLKLYKFCISLSVLARNCPHLNLLHLSLVNLKYDVSDCVPVFHNLEKVFLHHFTLIESDISQAITCLLSSAPNLNQLYFHCCTHFSSAVKTQILRCCEQYKLHIISFTTCSNINRDLLSDILLTCSTLKTLILDYCEIVRDFEAINELKMIATSLPNKPEISCQFIDTVYDNGGNNVNFVDDSDW